MSNDVILSIQNQLANINQGVLDEDTLAVAGSGVSNKRISIKGGVFRKIVGGKEVAALEDRHMNIVFVKLSHNPSRTYYTERYEEGAKISPVCWSSDSKKPDAEVKSPQATTCDKCQWSIKGTGQDGKGTACRLSWRTAVVLPSDPAGDVMQLVIPAASVFGDEESGRWPFRSYVQMLASHNISAQAVVTKMSFDTKAASPRILFNPVGVVSAEDLQTVREQGASHAAESAVKMTVYQRDETGQVAVPVATLPPAVAAVVEEAKAVAEAVVDAAIEVAEPRLRETGTVTAQAVEEKDVSAVISKWASKKKG